VAVKLTALISQRGRRALSDVFIQSIGSKGEWLMTIHDFSRPEGWVRKPAGALLDLLWGATLVTTFAFAAVLALTSVLTKSPPPDSV